MSTVQPGGENTEQEAALSEVLEELGDIPRRTVQDNLQTLCSIDLVELEGRGAGARWRLVEDSDQAAGDVQ